MTKFVGFIVPLLLAVVGIYFFCVAAFALIRSFSDTGFTVAAPGNTTITISKPGNYTLWNQTKTFDNGQFMTYPDQLPSGTTIKVLKKTEGIEVPMRAAMNSTMEVNGVRRVSVGALTFDAPGKYEVQVTGLAEKRSFYVDESKFLRMFVKFFGAGLLGVLFVAAAIGCGIFIAIRLSKNKNPAKA